MQNISNDNVMINENDGNGNVKEDVKGDEGGNMKDCGNVAA